MSVEFRHDTVLLVTIVDDPSRIARLQPDSSFVLIRLVLVHLYGDIEMKASAWTPDSLQAVLGLGPPLHTSPIFFGTAP